MPFHILNHFQRHLESPNADLLACQCKHHPSTGRGTEIWNNYWFGPLESWLGHLLDVDRTERRALQVEFSSRLFWIPWSERSFSPCCFASKISHGKVSPWPERWIKDCSIFAIWSNGIKRTGTVICCSYRYILRYHKPSPDYSVV